MATWQHLRSSTANKRPTTSLADGRIAINTNTASPGLFFKDSAGTGIVKVGPVHVGTTAPNSVPASGGSTGNYTGEQWLDTSVSPAQMKVWNGSTWVGIVADELPVSKLQDGAARQLIQTDAAGTGVEWTSNVDVPGTLDVTSTATFDSIAQHPLGTAGAPTITFTGDTNTGLYSPGADQVAISTNGTGRLFVDASGNVGVGPVSTSSFQSASSTVLSLRDTASSNIASLKVLGGAGAGAIAEYGATNGIGFCGTSGAHDFAFYTNSSERMRLDSSGRLGLGTSSPSYLLDVNGTIGAGTAGGVAIQLANGAAIRNSAAAANTIYFDTSFGSATHGSFEFRSSNAGTTRMLIDTSGRLGLGTSSPSTSLHTRGANSTTNFTITNLSALVTLQDTSSSAGAGPKIAFGCSYDGTNTLGQALIGSSKEPGSGSGGDQYRNSLVFHTSNIASGVRETMRLDPDGRLGIGTTSPARVLSVYSTSSIPCDIESSQNDSSLRLITAGGSGQICGIQNSSGNLLFNASGSERARIDSSGRLLVGTSTGFGNSTFTKAEFVNSASYTNIVVGRTDGASGSGSTIGTISFLSNAGGAGEYHASIAAEMDAASGSGDKPGRLVFSTTADGTSSPTERMRINNAGNVIFSNLAAAYPATDNAVTLGASGQRWSAVWAANGTIQTSDERAKTDINDAQLGSDFIKSLRPVSYKWIEGSKRDTGERDEDNNYIYEFVPGTRTHWGFIAQEVKQAVDAAGVDFGGWVLTDKDDPDSQQALRYDQFIAPLTKALQEALAEIEALKAKVAALEGA